MNKKRLFVDLNLRLFDGDGGAAADAGASGTTAAADSGTAKAEGQKAKADRNPLAKVVYGKQSAAQAIGDTEVSAAPETQVSADTAQARQEAFDKYVEENRDLFDARVQPMFNQRYKQAKQMEEQLSAHNSVFELLGSMYDVDPKDVNSIQKALEDDDGLYERRAMENGLTVQQQKKMDKLERIERQASFREQQEQQEVERQQELAKWTQQAEEAKRRFPGLDLVKEFRKSDTGSEFYSLLKHGLSVEHAYKAIYVDDILGGAMASTAQLVQQKTVNDIKARGLRPTENAVAGNGVAAVVKSDVSKLTRQDHIEIAKRAARGEPISF